MSNKDMRTIKFRGKRLDNAQWACGSLITTDRNIMIHIAHHEMFAIDPETVGQFTGLLDKNGNEIYEEDVIFESTDGVYTNWKIRYDVDLSQYRAENIGDECDDIQLSAVWLNRSEIIGNIHDNPELLTSKPTTKCKR